MDIALTRSTGNLRYSDIRKLYPEAIDHYKRLQPIGSQVMSDILSLFSIHCEKVQPLSKGQYVALCPFHDDN